MNKANWIRKNAALFRHAGEELKNIKAEKILLYRGFGVPLTAFFKNLFKSAEVTAITENDIDKEIADLMCADKITSTLPEDSFDIVFAPLSLTLVDSKAAIALLFSLTSAVKKSGVLYLSFFSTDKIDLEEKRVKAFYDEKETITIKKYTAEDVILSLKAFNFALLSINEDEVEGEKVITTVFKKI